MKAVDVSRVRTSSRETWLSTPLSDPNAALWASITPPANPTLTTQIRRRAAAFSLDLLAHRLFLRFPETFSSRSTARFAILGAAMALAAGVGALGYVAVTSSSLLAPSHQANVPAPSLASRPATDDDATSAPRSAGSTGLVRLGETAIERVAPTLAATAASSMTEQVLYPLLPRAALADADTTAPAAKHAASKKKAKSTARRAPKSRRARITND
jgi:hypothetical protein